MKPVLSLRWKALLVFACGTVVAPAATFKSGSTAFAKRAETNILSEPNALAAPAGKVAFAEPLVVDDVRGAWLHVKAKKGTGWIFEGNVAAEKPTLAPAAGLTKVDASSTNTVAAARPLSQAGADYAERHSNENARKDIDWLDESSAKVKPAAVETYLRTNKKGEFRQ